MLLIVYPIHPIFGCFFPPHFLRVYFDLGYTEGGRVRIGEKGAADGCESWVSQELSAAEWNCADCHASTYQVIVLHSFFDFLFLSTSVMIPYFQHFWILFCLYAYPVDMELWFSNLCMNLHCGKRCMLNINSRF